MEAEASSSKDGRGGKGDKSRERGKDAGKGEEQKAVALEIVSKAAKDRVKW